MQPIDQSACKKESWKFRMTDNYVINIDGFVLKTNQSTGPSIQHSCPYLIAVCSHKMLRYLFPLNTLNVNRDNVNENVENKSIRENSNSKR